MDNKNIINCLKSRFIRTNKIRLDKTYFFVSYLTVTDINSSKGYVIDDCYKEIFDFGEFNLRLFGGEANNQHDFRRLTKDMYKTGEEGIFPVVSISGFLDNIKYFEILSKDWFSQWTGAEITDVRFYELRASKENEQRYYKYTGDDENYFHNIVKKLLDEKFDIYRVGIFVRTKRKYYFEILRKGLIIYTTFNNAECLNEQLNILFSLLHFIISKYYSSIPYVKVISKLEYLWEPGIQPRYNLLAIHLKKPLTENKAREMFEEIKNNFGVISSEIRAGSLHIDWHLYDKQDIDSTVIVSVIDPKYPNKLVILPTSEKAKKSALKLYEIINSIVPIKTLDLSV